MDSVEQKREGTLVPPAVLPVLPLLLTDCIKVPGDNESEISVNGAKPFFNVIAAF